MFKLRLKERKRTEVLKDEESEKIFRKAHFKMKVVGKSQIQALKRNKYSFNLEVIDPDVKSYTKVDEESQDIKNFSDIFERKVTKRQYSRSNLGNYVNVFLYRANRGSNWYFSFASMKNRKSTKSGIELKI